MKTPLPPPPPRSKASRGTPHQQQQQQQHQHQQLGGKSSETSQAEYLILVLVLICLCGFASFERHGTQHSIDIHPLKRLRSFAVVINETFLHPPSELDHALLPPKPSASTSSSSTSATDLSVHAFGEFLQRHSRDAVASSSEQHHQQRRDFVSAARTAFSRHLYFTRPVASAADGGLVGYMVALHAQPACALKPLFVTLAQVRDDLYWQLIESFFYGMYNFGNLDCSVMICVSDSSCMQRCAERGFPCFDYRHPTPDLHVMQQVAEIKLRHVGDALQAGVGAIMLLDLDVGFLRDPSLLFDGFLENQFEQVRAQMDVGYLTDKVYKTSFSSPRPNFGLFLVKSHPYSVKAFSRAWRDYQKAPQRELNIVATDQNCIVNALKWARWRWDFNFSYFHLGFMLDTYPRPIHFPLKVLLLDKVALGKLDHDPNGVRFELGGQAAREVLGDAVAVHATCHEGSTNLNALRASNAFWHFGGYYDPQRRTLTKPLMALSKRALREELRALAWLALATNRSLIVPNVLIGVGTNVQGQPDCSGSGSGGGGGGDGGGGAGRRTPFCSELADYRNQLPSQSYAHAALHRGEYYWPSWRTLWEDLPALTVLEPGYYDRMRSADLGALLPPAPSLHAFDLAEREQSPGFALQALLASISSDPAPRLVLDLRDSGLGAAFRGGPPDLHGWAEDSVGAWGDGVVAKGGYLPLPEATDGMWAAQLPEEQYHLCKTFLFPIVGNRSCFDRCQ